MSETGRVDPLAKYFPAPYTYFCHKCHEDFYTYDKEYVEKIRGTKWKCNTCVWATL